MHPGGRCRPPHGLLVYTAVAIAYMICRGKTVISGHAVSSLLYLQFHLVLIVLQTKTAPVTLPILRVSTPDQHSRKIGRCNSTYNTYIIVGQSWTLFDTVHTTQFHTLDCSSNTGMPLSLGAQGTEGLECGSKGDFSFFITFRSGEEDRRAIAQDKLKAGRVECWRLERLY